jgi:hypothetical protein
MDQKAVVRALIVLASGACLAVSAVGHSALANKGTPRHACHALHAGKARRFLPVPAPIAQPTAPSFNASEAVPVMALCGAMATR